jgi:hypothetical protein
MLDMEGSMSGCEIKPLNRNHGLDYPTASGLVLADGLMVANAPVMVYHEAGLGWLWVAASFGDKGAQEAIGSRIARGRVKAPAPAQSHGFGKSRHRMTRASRRQAPSENRT